MPSSTREGASLHELSVRLRMLGHGLSISARRARHKGLRRGHHCRQGDEPSRGYGKGVERCSEVRRRRPQASHRTEDCCGTGSPTTSAPTAVTATNHERHASTVALPA